MRRARALLDSNVLVAALAGDHEHHQASAALLVTASPGDFAVAAHSFAEAFVTLTNQRPATPFGWTPGEAWAALESLAAVTVLVGLTPAQAFDAVRRYAGGGGLGPRLYDHLIGTTAIRNGLDQIITWNLSHMRGLFPDLTVMSPLEAA